LREDLGLKRTEGGTRSKAGRQTREGVKRRAVEAMTEGKRRRLKKQMKHQNSRSRAASAAAVSKDGRGSH